jgi:dTDP-4-dehydrorhamnose 3,5-epimerase
MKLINTKIKDLLIVQPNIFEDDRGYFFESYNKDTFKDLGLDVEFVQDNQSLSSKGVIRGLHFQIPDYGQVKLVRVTSGTILDVAVDIREGSETYGNYVSVILSSENKKMFYIPEGFAHGFATLEDNTTVQYKCSNFYNNKHDFGIMWNDTDLGINWGVDVEPIISDKDKNNIRFKDFKTPFKKL